MSSLDMFSINVRYSDIYPEYDCVLETSETQTKLLFLVNGYKQEINLTGNEERFIQKIEETGIFECDNQRYENPDVWDGYCWSVMIRANGKKVNAEGYNDYPEAFEKIIRYLFSYGLKKSDMIREVFRRRK